MTADKAQLVTTGLLTEQLQVSLS